jgi:hypothetical protein
MDLDSPGSEQNDRESTNLSVVQENGQRARCYSVVTPESHPKPISPTLSSPMGSTLTNNKLNGNTFYKSRRYLLQII